MHLEYERRGEGRIARRMLEYRGRIVNGHPGPRVRQYVLVLGDGVIDTSACDDEGIGFSLGLEAIYLRDRDPEAFLQAPESAPFAALAAGDAQIRRRSLVAAMRLIQERGGPRAAELLYDAERLASIRLDVRTIQEAREESGMSIEAEADWLEQMDVGQELRRRGEARGEARARTELLAVLLRSRFGDHPAVPVAAERLAAWPDAEAAVRAVTGATVLDDLLDTDVPTQRQP